MNTETQQAILAEVMAEIERRPKYQFELVMVDYRDGFDIEQVEMLAQGDWEGLYSSIEEWESDARWESSRGLLEDILGDLDDWDEGVLNEWQHTDAGMEAYMAILDRDESNPLSDLAAHSGNVLLRVRNPEEDDDTPYYVFAVTVRALFDLPAEGMLRVTNAYPWRGDAFWGGGIVGDEPVEIVVDRKALHTDIKGPGYSWTEVASPAISYYESKIEPITEEVNA